MFGVTMARSSKSSHASRIAVDARRDAAVDLADDDGAAAAVVNHARLDVVRAEVHERADRSLGADDVGDRELVQSILRRDDAAVVAQMREQRARGALGVMRLRREDDRVPLAAQCVRRERGHAHDELGDRAGDAEARVVDRVRRARCTLSTSVTSWPARARYAPIVPPIAPAPQMRNRMVFAPRLRVAPGAVEHARGSPRPQPSRARACPRRAADRSRRSCRRRGRCAARRDRARAPCVIDHRPLRPSGSSTSGSRVQGKFSIHEPCDATGSIACTLAHVCGAFHQLWKITRQSG